MLLWSLNWVLHYGHSFLFSVFFFEKYSSVILDNKKWKAIPTLSFKKETWVTKLFLRVCLLGRKDWEKDKSDKKPIQTDCKVQYQLVLWKTQR